VPPPAKRTPNKRSLSPSEIGVKETGVECQFRVKGRLAVRERGTSASHRLLALGFAACFIVPAHAVHWDWDIGYRRPGFVHHHYRDHLSDIERQRVRLYQEAEIDAEHRAEHREGRRDECGCDDDRGFHCLEPIRGVGTEWIGKEGALKGARKDWMERVRYDHGERFIDMTNDRDEVSRCSRVSIGEVAGQVMYRCEIVARPCQANMEQAHMEGSPAHQEEERK